MMGGHHMYAGKCIGGPLDGKTIAAPSPTYYAATSEKISAAQLWNLSDPSAVVSINQKIEAYHFMLLGYGQTNDVGVFRHESVEPSTVIRRLINRYNRKRRRNKRKFR